VRRFLVETGSNLEAIDNVRRSEAIDTYSFIGFVNLIILILNNKAEGSQ